MDFRQTGSEDVMWMEMDQDSAQKRAQLKAKISYWLHAPCFEITIYYL